MKLQAAHSSASLPAPPHSPCLQMRGWNMMPAAPPSSREDRSAKPTPTGSADRRGQGANEGGAPKSAAAEHILPLTCRSCACCCCTVCHWLRKSRVCLTRARAAGVAPRSSTRPCCGCNGSQWRVITPHDAHASVQEDLQSSEQDKPVCSPHIRFLLLLCLRVMPTSFICTYAA